MRRDALEPPVSTTVAGYELGAVVRRPGIGAVHEARAPSGEPVWLWLRPPGDADRFADAAAALAGLTVPGVPRALAYGEAEQGLYLVTAPLPAATSLEQALAGGPLPPQRAIRLLGDAADALDAAHRAGVLHRMLRPAALLVQPQPLERCHLVDFCLGMDRGEFRPDADALAYAAPEELRGRPASEASDRYAFACIAFETLAGTPPFATGSAPALREAHLLDPPPRATAVRPGLPAGIDDALVAGLAKSPADRPPTAAELVAALARALLAARPAKPASTADPRAGADPATTSAGQRTTAGGGNPGSRRAWRPRRLAGLRPERLRSLPSKTFGGLRAKRPASKPPAAAAAKPPARAVESLPARPAAGPEAESATPAAVPTEELPEPKPAAHAGREPATPATRQPTTPATREPATPATRQPTTPATRQPTTPATRQPATPAEPEPSAPTQSEPAPSARRDVARRAGFLTRGRREGAGRAWRPLGVAVALLGLAGAGGWAAGQRGGGDDRERFSSGSVDVVAPAGWSASAAVPAIRGLELREAAGLRRGRAAIVVGIAEMSVFPERMASGVDPAAGRGDAIRIGDLDARRWRTLRERGSGPPLTLVAAPTGDGLAVIACRGAGRACDAATATLKVPGAEPVALDSLAFFGARLSRTLGALDRNRRAGAAALRAAPSRARQARAADDLARDYRRAESAIGALAVPPSAEEATAAITASLGRLSGDYGALARAARRGHRDAYRSAARSLRRHEAALRRTLARL